MNRENRNIDSIGLLKTNFEIISVFLEYSDWYQALDKVFSLVGSQINVDRIYYFEIHPDPITGTELTSQRFEWVKDGIEPMIDNPELQNIPAEFASDFMEPLKKRQPFEAIVRELPASNTKEILSSQDIQSILVLPIMISDRLYGFIGFDDCTTERIWNEDELNFLQSITSNLSSAISRRNALLEVESKAKELRIINEELEQFAFVASHDLQEPLRMITSFLGLFENKYGNIVDDEGKSYINFAMRGAVSMKKIINDLLEFSRIGRKNELMEEVDLRSMTDELISIYANRIGEKKAKVILANPIKLIACKVALQQVLLNLLDNSLKYSRVDVSPEIVISIQEKPAEWYFSFSDNGIGIQPQYFNKVFVIFQRLHAKSDYEGNGVGLAISKKIIENLGGKIWVTSEPGLSTTFHFTLPRQ